jgi:hypothetical protein
MCARDRPCVRAKLRAWHSNQSIKRLNMRKTFLATVGIALGAIAGDANAQLPAGLVTQSTVITSVPAGSITANQTWCDNEDTMVLQGPVFVKNGAILTILAPCIVRGQPRTAAAQQGVTAGTPGALIITQDGRIVANGRPTAPIVFTTAVTDTDGNNIPDVENGFLATWQSGEAFYDDNPFYAPTAPLDKAGLGTDQLWGSLVILGRAPTNLADRCLGDDDGDPNTPLPALGWGQCTIEGLTFPGFPAADAAYGGVIPNDNSGVVRYVSLRHGGDQFGLDNELNGLSLGGVGTGTVIENVEIYVNFDDGFEWFGGTVWGKNLLVAFVGDDMFDADEGYTGTNQNLFGIMPYFNENGGTAFGFGSGDKATEFDGENYRPDNTAQNDNLTTRIRVDQNTVNPNPWPQSGPSFYNMTLIGTTLDASPDFAPASAAGVNRGAQMRNGFAGNIHNSIVVNTGSTRGGFEVDTNTSTSPAGFSTVDNTNAGLVNVVCSTFDDTLAPGAGSADLVASTNGNAMCVMLGGTAPGCNNSFNPGGPGGADDFLGNEDVTFPLTGDANGKLVPGLKTTPINPRPRTGLGQPIGGCPAPSGPGLSPVTVRGAFPTAGSLWACPWSVLCISGLMQ